MYSLYLNKRNKKLEIKPLRKGFEQYKDKLIETPHQHNDCYYICSKRKLLLELAREIKLLWLKEAQDELKEIDDIIVR